MLSRRDDSEDVLEEGINLSPLIDMMFLLLLFFIVSSVFVKESGVEVKKPESRQSRPLDSESLHLAVTAQGGIFFGGDEIGLHGIVPALKRSRLKQAQAVILQVDGAVSTQRVVEVIDEVKKAGFDTVSLATKRK